AGVAGPAAGPATAAAALMPNSSSMAFTASTTSSTLHSFRASTNSFGVIFVVAISISSSPSDWCCSVSPGGRGQALVVRGALQLFPVGLEQADQLLDGRLDGCNQLSDRALQGAQQLGQQDLARRQVRHLPDRLRRP